MKKIIFSALILGITATLPVHAQNEYNFTYVGFDGVTLDDSTAQKGYTLQMFDDHIRFGITPGVLTEGGGFEFKELVLEENSGMEIPHGYKLVSKILEFDIKNKDAYDPLKPFWLQMKFDSSLEFDKFLFYFDQGKGRWVQIPSTTDLENGYIRAAFHLPYAKLAVFDTETMIYGHASWYAYKDCMCAASPDYPKGTELLVTNHNENESIVVTINDWGPERDIFPKRVIDLDAVAFKKLGTLGMGVLHNISVLPYHEKDFTETENVLLQSGDVLPMPEEKFTLIAGDENLKEEASAADTEIAEEKETDADLVTEKEQVETTEDKYYFVD